MSGGNGYLQTVDLQTVKSFSLGLLDAVQHFSLSSKTETNFKLVLLGGLVPLIHQRKKTTASKIKTRDYDQTLRIKPGERS